MLCSYCTSSLAASMGNRRTFKSLHSVNKCNPSERNLLSHRLEMGLFFQINFLSFSSFNSKDIFLTESVRKIRALVVLIFVGVIIFSMVLIKSSQQALIRLTWFTIKWMDRSCCFCFILFVMDIVLTFAVMVFVKCLSFFDVCWFISCPFWSCR